MLRLKAGNAKWEAPKPLITKWITLDKLGTETEPQVKSLEIEPKKLVKLANGDLSSR